MIRFCCEHCGRIINVRDKYTGKRGKCPECGTAFVVPTRAAAIELQCENCAQKINVPKTYPGTQIKCPSCNFIITLPARPIDSGEEPARFQFTCSVCNREIKEPESSRGKLVSCPHCRSFVAVPSLPPSLEKAEIPIQLEEREDTSEETFGELQTGSIKGFKHGPDIVTERKLPWILDIFLYPTSTGGLLTLATLILLRLITDVATMVLMCCFFGGILSLIIRVVLVWSYTYWYFSECVRDSADGGLRAPDIAGRMPGLGDMFWQWARLFACFAIFLGPVVFYGGYTYFASVETNNVVLLSLLAYGAFLFPMNVLAVVMFDSVNGMNPILVIRSIIGTFLQYCGLFILFYGSGILFITIFRMILRASSRTQFSSGVFFSYILFNLFMAYALLVTGHLLGRFYWRYQNKLNWGV
jgi:DNA-directed RNA polymerase subunit RPC12/RpoP